jgi:P4 family phage/plasmid primase-like protien
MFQFLTANKFKFIGVTTTLTEEGKKDIKGIYSGWQTKTPEELANNFKTRGRTFKQILMRGHPSFLVIDTDEEEQHAELLKILTDMDLYKPSAITESFRGRECNFIYKRHFWFSVNKEDIYKSKGVKFGTNKLNGYDVLYDDNCQILEWTNSILTDLPPLSYTQYDEIITKMNAKFPSKQAEPPAKPAKPKKETKPIRNTTADEEPSESEDSSDSSDSDDEPRTFDSKYIDHIKKVLKGLNSYRCNDYDDWLKIAMIFVNERLPLDLFDDFSKQSKHYNEHGNASIINNLMKKSHSGPKLGLPTLYQMLKEDNYELFCKLQKDRRDFWQLMNKLSDSDCAKLYYNLEPSNYLFSSVTGWYEYNEFNVLEHTEREPINLQNDITDKLQDYVTEQHKLLNPGADNYKQKTDLINKNYKKLGTAKFISGVISYLRPLYRVKNVDDLFNANSDLIAFTDAVYDVKTNQFRPIKPMDYITKTTKYPAPVNSFNQDCQSYLKNLLLDIFGKQELAEYWLTVTGLSLFTTKIQSLFLLTGSGGNGKGILNNLIRHALGEYYYAPENTFLTTPFSANQPNPSLYQARGVRYLSVSEPDNGRDNHFNVDFVKALSGGDSITTRTLYDRKNISYIPQFTGFVQCNQKPKLARLDQGIMRRIKIIHYPFNYVDKPTKPNEKQRDYNLPDKLKTPLIVENFILLLFSYAHKYINEDVEKIPMPREVQAVTSEYMDENNPVKDWLNSRIQITGEHTNTKHRIKTTEALEDYNSTAEQKLNAMKFAEYMKFNEMPVIKSGNYRYYTGVTWKVEEPEGDEINDDMFSD